MANNLETAWTSAMKWFWVAISVVLLIVLIVALFSVGGDLLGGDTPTPESLLAFGVTAYVLHALK